VIQKRDSNSLRRRSKKVNNFRKKLRKHKISFTRSIAVVLSILMVLSLAPMLARATPIVNEDIEPTFSVDPSTISLGIVAVPLGEAPPSQVYFEGVTYTITWEQAAVAASQVLDPFQILPIPGGNRHFTGAIIASDPFMPGMNNVGARFIGIPSDTVLYIDSIGTHAGNDPLNGITPAFTGVSNLLGDQLINDRADQPWVAGARFGHAGNSSTRNIMDGGREGEANRLFDPWMYGHFDTPGDTPIRYYFYLMPGTYTVVSGHHQWWTSSARPINTSIQVGDAAPINIGSITLPNVAATVPGSMGTINGQFTVPGTEPTRVIYRIHSSFNPVVSWVGVYGEVDSNQLVSLNANSGTFLDGNASREIRLIIEGNTYATLYAEENIPVRLGFEFLGWFDAAQGGNRISPEDVVSTASARSLYAQWDYSDEPVQVVTLNANSGRFPNGETSLIVLVDFPGTYHYLFTTEYLPTRQGYEKIGWFTDPVGGTQVFNDTEVMNLPSQTLYARWEAGEASAVTFNMNRYFYTGGNNQRGVTHPTLRRPLTHLAHLTVGAYFGDALDTNYETLLSRYAAFDVAIGMRLTLPATQGAGGLNDNNTFQNRMGPVDLEDGFEFVGWFTAPVGGEQVTANQIFDGSINVLYAQWSIPITVDGEDILANAHLDRSLTYKGAGILSANSTSALLMDYKYMNPDSYWQLLDNLFGGDRPLMHRVKVEIGNDRNTSTGPNPATRRYADEPVNVARDPGFQLMADALYVNPNVRTSILRWTLPPFAADGAGTWTSAHMNTMYRWYRDLALEVYRQYGFMLTYIAPDQNEPGPGRTFGLGFLDFHMRFAGWVANEPGYGQPESVFQSVEEERQFRQIRVTASDEYTLSNIGPRMIHGTTAGTQGGVARPRHTGEELRGTIPAVNYHYNMYDDNIVYRIYRRPDGEPVAFAIGALPHGHREFVVGLTLEQPPIAHISQHRPTILPDYEYERTVVGSFTVLSDIFNIEVWNSEKQASFGNTAFRPNNNTDNNIRTTPDPTHGEPAWEGSTGIGGIISGLEMGNAQIKGFAESRRTHFIYQPAISAHYYGSEWGWKELVEARDPWSGFMQYDSALYVLRHFSWFAKRSGWNDFDANGNVVGMPVWHTIPSASDSTSVLRSPAHGRDGAANFMTLAAPSAEDFSTVIINDSPFPRTYTFEVKNLAREGLPTLEVWETRAADAVAGEPHNSNYMQLINRLSPRNNDVEVGFYTLEVAPFSIVTVTSLENEAWINDWVSEFGNLPVNETRDREVLDLSQVAQSERHSDHIQSAVENWDNGTGTFDLDVSRVLWADSFNYEGRQVRSSGNPHSDARVSAGTPGYECFMISRGYRDLTEQFSYPRSQQGFYPLLFHNRQGALEVVNSPNVGGWALRSAIDSQNRGGAGGAWHGGDPIASMGDDRWMNYRASVDVAFHRAQNTIPGHGANYAAIGVRFFGGGSGGPQFLPHDGIGSRTPYFLYLRPDGFWNVRSFSWGGNLIGEVLSVNGTWATGALTGNIATMVDEDGERLFPDFVPNTTNQWVNIALQAAGNRITAYIDGIHVATFYDERANQFRAGRVQLGSGFHHTYFRNILVESVDGYQPYYSYVKDDLEMHDLANLGTFPGQAQATRTTPERRLIYEGTWIHTSGRGQMDRSRTLTYNRAAGNTLTYTFRGTGLDLIGPNDGIVPIRVWLNGAPFILSDTTRASISHFPAYMIRGLPYDQENTITIEMLNSNHFVIDAVGIVSGNVSNHEAIDVTALREAYEIARNIDRIEELSEKTVAALTEIILETNGTTVEVTDAVWNFFTMIRTHAHRALYYPEIVRLDQEGADAITLRLTEAIGVVTEFAPVEEISGVPSRVTVGSTFDLRDAVVLPVDFFREVTIWEITSGLNEGVVVLDENVLTFVRPGVVQLQATVPYGLGSTDFVYAFTINAHNYFVVNGLIAAEDVATFGAAGVTDAVFPEGIIRAGIGSRGPGFLNSATDWWSGIGNGNGQNAGGNRMAFLRFNLPEDVYPEDVVEARLNFSVARRHNQGPNSLSIFTLQTPLPQNFHALYNGVATAAAGNAIRGRYQGQSFVAQSNMIGGTGLAGGLPLTFDISAYVAQNPSKMYEFAILADSNMLDLFNSAAVNPEFRPYWEIVVLDTEEPEPPTLREQLVSLISEAESLNQADFTAQTWMRVQTGLVNARRVVANANATDNQLLSALNNLQTAVDNLVER
jgi:hypothetical protein